MTTPNKCWLNFYFAHFSMILIFLKKFYTQNFIISKNIYRQFSFIQNFFKHVNFYKIFEKIIDKNNVQNFTCLKILNL